MKMESHNPARSERLNPTDLRMIKASERTIESSHCSGGVCQMSWKPAAKKPQTNGNGDKAANGNR